MADSDPRPNVLLVCTDHWPGRYFNFAGHPAILTPTLDSLAQSGIHYPNAYSECPVCVPARRTLMTGLSPRSHGMRDNRVRDPMPDVPTMAQTFRDHGYQATAVGKLHVNPQRSRIGFDEVFLDEEGRAKPDDYEVYLGDQGFPGQRFAGGMSNNEYAWRPWHLPEHCHVTNWATRELCRTFLRRDPSKPGFYYLSYSHPHPPLAPLQAYLDLYRGIPMEEIFTGDWVHQDPPYPPRLADTSKEERRIADVRRAFLALCTHIDHQLRVVIGTLNHLGLTDNTILLFTADHGDMLGHHGRWAKRIFLEDAAQVPMILSLPPNHPAAPTVANTRDERLVAWADVMPSLLELCRLPIPAHCEGLPMTGEDRRDYLFGEVGEPEKPGANRMIRRGKYKLIYFPVGNRRLLFDLEQDPRECRDLSTTPDAQSILEELTGLLIAELRYQDGACLEGDRLVGVPASEALGAPAYSRGLSGQRGWPWL